jgi:hypothetical protein
MGAEVKMAKPNKVRADMILRQLAKRHNGKTPDAFFTEVKNGSTWFNGNLMRLDAVAFKKSWQNPCITAYEVKVDRQDFLRDDKWPGYRNYCHRLYFACPTDLIAANELPEDVGLVYYNPEKDCLYTKRKAVFREIEMPVEMLYYLVVSRLKSDKHPFFSSQREFLMAWLEDKEERKYLGYHVKSKINRMNKEINSLKGKIAEREHDAEILKKVEKVMQEHGIGAYSYNIERNLREALKQGMPPNLTNSLQLIEREVKKLITATGKEAQS